MLRIMYFIFGGRKEKRKHPYEMFDIVSNYSIAEESGVDSQKNLKLSLSSGKNSNWSGCQEFTNGNAMYST